MDRQRIKGGLKKVTGTIKEKTGEALGDRHLETEGKAEKAEGRIRSGVGKAMDAVREVVNNEKWAKHEKAGSEGDSDPADTHNLLVNIASGRGDDPNALAGGM